MEPEVTENTTPEATTSAAEQQNTGQEETPPWGDDFDPARAWKTIQNLREREKELSKVEALTPEHKQQLEEYNRLVEASKSDMERAQEERDRWQAEADKWRSASMTSRIEALAANDFAFPADAVEKLKANNYLDAGGVIDDAAIRRDLAAILEERPHWRKQPETVEKKPRVPAPNPGQGSGGGNPVADPRQEFAAILQGQLNR